jgi:uncharacterized membrane protein YkoI
MTLSKRLYWIAGLVAVIALAAAAVTMVSTRSSAQTTPPTSTSTGTDTVVPCSDPTGTDSDTETADEADTDNVEEQCGDQNDDDANEADDDNNEIDGGDGEVDDDNGDPANAGQLDDGQDMLPQASITIDQAIAAAQAAADGDIGEIDLEYHNGKLVVNVDVGKYDVKVDAANGDVLGAGED